MALMFWGAGCARRGRYTASPAAMVCPLSAQTPHLRETCNTAPPKLLAIAAGGCVATIGRTSDMSNGDARHCVLTLYMVALHSLPLVDRFLSIKTSWCVNQRLPE